MVDAALEATGAVQSWVRLLPSRVVVYLLLAGALFADIGYRGVWAGPVCPVSVSIADSADSEYGTGNRLMAVSRVGSISTRPYSS
nr:transposase domain-containing protein [Nocardia arizonensis]